MVLERAAGLVPPLAAQPGSPRKLSYNLLLNFLAEIAEEVLPERRYRINPRVIKRKMSNWRKKRPEHRRYSQPSKKFRKSVVIELSGIDPRSPGQSPRS
jgi:hypothetical protein